MELGWRLADIGGEGEKLVSKGVSCWLGESWKLGVWSELEEIVYCLSYLITGLYTFILERKQFI